MRYIWYYGLYTDILLFLHSYSVLYKKLFICLKQGQIVQVIINCCRFSLSFISYFHVQFTKHYFVISILVYQLKLRIYWNLIYHFPRCFLSERCLIVAQYAYIQQPYLFLFSYLSFSIISNKIHILFVNLLCIFQLVNRKWCYMFCYTRSWCRLFKWLFASPTFIFNFPSSYSINLSGSFFSQQECMSTVQLQCKHCLSKVELSVHCFVHCVVISQLSVLSISVKDWASPLSHR